MKKSIVLGFLVMVMILGIVVGVNLKSVSAQSATFSGVIPFSTQGGLMGFFDQNSGKLYLYSPELDKCLYIYQGNEIGKPFKAL